MRYVIEIIKSRLLSHWRGGAAGNVELERAIRERDEAETQYKATKAAVNRELDRISKNVNGATESKPQTEGAV